MNLYKSIVNAKSPEKPFRPKNISYRASWQKNKKMATKLHIYCMTCNYVLPVKKQLDPRMEEESILTKNGGHMSKMFNPVTNDVIKAKNSLLLQKISCPNLIEKNSDNNSSKDWQTIKFEKANILINNSKCSPKQFEVIGEFYVIANVKSDNDILDENGDIFSSESMYVSRLKRESFHPLEKENKSLVYLKTPEWFVDINMVIMEIKTNSKAFQQIIDETDENVQFSLFLHKYAN